MPRNQGTSRKGKPKKHEREAGMGRALQKAQHKPHISKPSRGGMAMTPGVESINVQPNDVDARASVLEMNDLDDFLMQAEMANREFASEKEQLVVLDANTTSALSNGEFQQQKTTTITWSDDDLQKQQLQQQQFAFQELSVPRRPVWTKSTTPEELEHMEVESFLEWRRAIAKKEEQIALMQQNNGGGGNGGGDNNTSSSFLHLGVTPFEKNLEIWRQLWRVMERCSIIVQIVDARNPLFYLSQDLKTYATKELGKPMILLINKSDYLTPGQRQAWHDYLSTDDNKGKWHHIFFSAHQEQQRLDQNAHAAAKAEAEVALQTPPIMIRPDDDSDDDDDDQERNEKAEKEEDPSETPNEAVQITTDEPKIDVLDNVGIERALTREELLDWLHTFAIRNDCAHDSRHEERIPFGMVGFPNVGKSSVINVLMGNTKHAHGVVRVGVAAQPGKTKHFQTLLLPERDDVLLCDCPGLVFPSFVNNTADLLAAGVYPIAQMRDHTTVMGLVCQRIPRQVLNARYGIRIPVPGPDRMLAFEQQQRRQKEQEQQRQGKSSFISESLPPPTAEEFLTTYCAARSIADMPRAARHIIKEYAAGKLLYCHAPPTMGKEQVQEFYNETLVTAMNVTKKLHDKLKKASVPGMSTMDDEELDEMEDDDDDDDDIGEGGTEGNGVEDDDFMFELMDEVSSEVGGGNRSTNNHKKSNKPPKTKKWGKKGRKFQNRDPYGCHSTSAEEMLNSAGMGPTASVKVPHGISVKAGKYGSSGYTRPQGYGGARSAA